MHDWDQKIAELEKEVQKLKKVNSELESRILRLEQNSRDAESNPRGHNPAIDRLNCWEFKKCSRETGGTNVPEFGVCPASEWKEHEGINGGKIGGRVCWTLVGTLCGGRVQGIYTQKIGACSNCEFYQYVRLQEKQDFRYALPTKK